MKKVLSIILIVICLGILIVNVCSIFGVSIFGFRLLKVASGSMEPTLPINSLILIKECNEYKENDIVTYKDNGGYTTHRVLQAKQYSFITKGDANTTLDKEIAKDDVVGKVILTISIFRHISDLIEKPIFWVVILIIGFLFVLRIPIDEEQIYKEQKEKELKKGKEDASTKKDL